MNKLKLAGWVLIGGLLATSAIAYAAHRIIIIKDERSELEAWVVEVDGKQVFRKSAKLTIEARESTIPEKTYQDTDRERKRHHDVESAF